MTRIARYLTHPEVVVDPDRPVADWGLSATGRARAEQFAHRGILQGTTRVIASTERKAIETATPLARALGCALETDPDMSENDRTATGYLPEAAFEATADAFFARPQESIRGWERAIDAQARICRAVRSYLGGTGDLLFVGHGAVGSLLYCALAGQAISREHDQFSGGGCVFSFDPDTGQTHGGWQRMERYCAT